MGLIEAAAESPGLDALAAAHAAATEFERALQVIDEALHLAPSPDIAAVLQQRRALPCRTGLVAATPAALMVVDQALLMGQALLPGDVSGVSFFFDKAPLFLG